MRDMHILISGEVLTLSINTDTIKQVGFNKEILQLENGIINISVTGSMIIIVTEDADSCNGSNRVDFVKPYNIKKNNINAYDWDGNHLWNISDIVGEINMAFSGGCVSSISKLSNHYGFDQLKYNADSEIYVCTAGGKMYVIDLKGEKVIQILPAY